MRAEREIRCVTSHRRRVLLGIIVSLVSVILPTVAHGQAHVNGAWSQKFDAQAIGIHAALVRIPGSPDSSRLLYWGNTPSQGTGYRLWNPGTPSSVTEATSTTPGHNLFCAGHSFLEDGRLLIVGGTYIATTGLDLCYIFTMGSPPTWTQTASPMKYGRWYPTSTTLATGSVLANSGLRYQHALSFGGASPTGSRRQGRALTLGLRPHWKDSLTIALPDVEDAATIDSGADDLTFFVFGGRADDGTLTNKVWRIAYASEHPTNENQWTITELTTSGSLPSARRLHTAVYDYNTTAKTGVFWVYGGIDSNGTVLNDVYKFTFTGYPLAALSGTWTAISGPGPGARYGHVAVFDSVGSGYPGSMLMFGGRKQDGTLADNDVHRFDFGTETWSQVSLRQNSPRPASRWLHKAISTGVPVFRREGLDVITERRWLIHGGRDGSGQTIDETAWSLWLPQSATSYLPVWEAIEPRPDPAYGRPAKRSRHALTYSDSPHRFILFGGDSSAVATDALTGGAKEDIWSLSTSFPHSTDSPDTSRWTRLFADSAGPGARVGHSLHYDGRGVTARIAELYNPATESWQQTHTKYLRLYPYMFPTPRGTVFHAGPAYITQEYSVVSGWGSDADTTEVYGGSAVAYGQGDSLIIMKAGFGKGAVFEYDFTGIVGIPAGSSTPVWSEEASVPGTEMLPRANHNLTALPNGQILVTGGTVSGESLSPQKAPQLWNPLELRWSGALAEDPAMRDYHSTAILLPDARVWSAGGDRNGADKFTAAFYSPPFLFRNGDTLAVRPVIQACPDSVLWGHAFSVRCDDVGRIRSACLIRPGAVTHAFNQDQRYLPLAIRDSIGSDLVLDAPKDSLWAPPGDYLLFVVDASGVPSVAKWVRVRGGPQSGNCAAIAPAVVSVATDGGRESGLLMWNAPGENALCGTVHSYDLRRSNSTITNANFYSATPMTAPAPLVAGSEHCVEVDNLNPCGAYSFAFKTRDAAGVWSKVSVGTVQTDCSGYEMMICDGGGLFAGGGGGGGSLRQTIELSRAGSEPVTSAEEPAGENSILWATDSGHAVDLRRVTGLAADGNGQYTIPLRHVGNWKASLDQLALGYVDHATAEVAIAGPDRVLVGMLGAVAGVVDDKDLNVTGLTGTDGQPREIRAGEHLTVSLNRPTAKTAIVVAASWRAARSGENLSGIRVQTLGSDGTWTTVGEIQPRRQFDRSAMLVGPSTSVRLVFPRTCTVRSLAQLEVDRQVLPEPLQLVSATKPEGGAVTVAVGSAGGEATTVAPGESLTVTFAAPAASGEGIRELFLLARGSLAPTESQGTVESARLTSEVREPFVNHLGQARPNPSAGEVTIDFTLAQRSPVSFRVYDVSGRLVRSLVNEELAEGPQSVLWDGRNDAGQRVGAGVFFYRLIAGSWHSERKLIVLQR